MRSPALIAVTGLLCFALPALAGPPSPRLVEARKLIDDLEMESALKALDAADKAEGNDRATVLEILTLQGIAFGTLGKDAKTRDSFRKLLMLSPQATLPADQPPRVRTPFFEAREWVSSNGPLSATADFEVGAGQVQAVRVTVQKDVLRMARIVRFHLTTGGPEQTVDVPLAAGKAEAPVGKPAVSWWAELLSDKKGVLIELGSAAAPREDRAPGAAGLSSNTGPAEVETQAPVPGGWRRPAGLVLLGAGVVSAGVGVLLGVQSAATRAQITSAATDDQGRVTGLTQRDAAPISEAANTQAAVANLLFGVGGALGAAGVVLVIIGPSTEPTVALAPTAGGLLLSGAF